MQTYWWLAALAGNVKAARDAVGKGFRSRVARIRRLLPERITDDRLRDESLGAWQEAEHIANFRNAILHNPIILGWQGASETGPPDMIGVPDFAHLGLHPPSTKRIASLDEINASVNAQVDLAMRLEQLLGKCDQLLSAKGGSA